HPQLAANVANALVEQLDRINKEKSSSKAKNSRVYIENQLKQTEEKLKRASEELVDFKKKHKAVALEQQTEAAIKEAGEIKGRIIAKEVELGVAMQSLKPDHISIIRLKKELEELRKQYDYLQYGGEESFKTAKEFFIPFAEVPGVGLDLARLMREVKVQETVWELLNQQYYHAKIQEARDTPTVQVLDEAVPPETRSKPKRKLIVLVGAFLLLLGSVFWAYALDFYQTLQQDPKSRAKSQLMFKDFKSDIDKLKSLTKRKKRNQKKRSN
ncbi:MAG: GNVR domain-containing protein, partial [bacterium]|nr:GNVR domain-containing protein [bacterium]